MPIYAIPSQKLTISYLVMLGVTKIPKIVKTGSVDRETINLQKYFWGSSEGRHGSTENVAGNMFKYTVSDTEPAYDH